jgi:hypothetical protein
MCIFFFPLLTGRLLFQTVGVSSSFIHDPACYSIGLALLKNLLQIVCAPKFFNLTLSILRVTFCSWKGTCEVVMTDRVLIYHENSFVSCGIGII